MDRRRLLETIKGANDYETHFFTISEKNVRTQVIKHGLGRIPKFAILYPINIEKAHETDDRYGIAYGIFTNQLGQSDYNVSLRDLTLSSTCFNVWFGTGYDIVVPASSYPQIVDSKYVYFNEREISIGASGINTGHGHFLRGEFGVIIG